MNGGLNGLVDDVLIYDDAIYGGGMQRILTYYSSSFWV